ncbi:MAG: hypothetical protein H6R10_723 [Rhodocyclaceae bacterium]|nr:hypothetical protein [Rhodocyclaceae bacterium]
MGAKVDATVFILFVLTLYFLPTVIAWSRDHDGMVKIFLLNLFFGWTAIGWIGALFWSISSSSASFEPSPATPVQQEDSGQRIRCPECAELILKMAKVCKHCGHKLDSPSENEDVAA